MASEQDLAEQLQRGGSELCSYAKGGVTVSCAQTVALDELRSGRRSA